MTRHKARLIIGLLIGALFLFLAFRKVDFGHMAEAFRNADYWLLLPVLPVLILSHFLRALRWRYLLDPLERLDLWSLFSSLLIGYMANIFMPAHLGEFLRAYVLAKRRGISAGATFATIVMERIIDVFSLLFLMALAVLVYPFPPWVRTSGYAMLAATIGLFFFLVLLKRFCTQLRPFLSILMRPLPIHLRETAWGLAERFIAGIVPLKQWHDYIAVTVLSIIIWLCYGLIFWFSLYAFDFVRAYHLPWSTSLILLVITTIGVVVPSSPGYVGTYHFLCQVSLEMFGVGPGPALSFGTVVHAVTFAPVLVIGLILAYREGIQISKMGNEGDERPGV